jgi:hypothetical protein
MIVFKRGLETASKRSKIEFNRLLQLEIEEGAI